MWRIKNIDGRCFILIGAFVLCNILLMMSSNFFITTSLYREISEDVTFIHEAFLLPPSMRAIIEVNVSFPYRKQRQNPIMGIYTTHDHINIVKQCTDIEYGQLANRNLHPNLTMSGHQSGPLRCELTRADTLRCMGIITVQDFIPRKFSFSFGFNCDEIGSTTSLRGLVYNINAFTTNETKCFSLPNEDRCYSYIQHGVYINLFGFESNMSYNWSQQLKVPCYQHILKLLCYTKTPKCDPVSKQIIHPCREMCHDWLNGCSTSQDYSNFSINCNYLPSLNGDIPCLYEPVTCNEPPRVPNATVTTQFAIKGQYYLHDTVEYSCHEGLWLEGNKVVKCMHNGQWSTPPRCSKPTIQAIAGFLINCLGIFIPVVFATQYLIIQITYRFNSKSAEKVDFQTEQEKSDNFTTDKNSAIPSIAASPSKRNREFDAFVLFCFDRDNDYILNILFPEMEETWGFKLHLHSRDFTPGRDITSNIEEAIEASNSAIIVMSQGFVDSPWCKEEFTQCYLENMRDPAFRMFVLMMQPPETLVEISDYMKTFFARKTYLEMDDPEVYTKLAENLEDARQSE